MEGRMIIVSAPSGAGKTTVVKHLLTTIPALEFSVSACSRAKRGNEVDGKDYYFISAELFKEKIRNDEFLEWEEVYENNFYGTLKSEVDRIWAKGNHIIFDVDVKGGLNIKKLYPENSLAIFIKAPSLKILEQRLRNRLTDSEESLRKRVRKAAFENTFSRQFDKTIINRELDKTLDKSVKIVNKFLLHKS